jgi:hypothetical protein
MLRRFRGGKGGTQRVTALVGSIPMALATIAILLFGVETRGRPLEQITAAEFKRAGVVP